MYFPLDVLVGIIFLDLEGGAELQWLSSTRITLWRTRCTPRFLVFFTVHHKLFLELLYTLTVSFTVTALIFRRIDNVIQSCLGRPWQCRTAREHEALMASDRQSAVQS